MRILGRIILLIVGGCLIGFAIPPIINIVQTLQANNWNFQYLIQHMELLSSLITHIVNVSFGLTAVFAGLFGRASFGLLFTALIMVGCVIWFIYTNNVAGTLNTPEVRAQLIPNIILPSGYFLGAIFLLIGRRRAI